RGKEPVAGSGACTPTDEVTYPDEACEAWSRCKYPITLDDGSELEVYDEYLVGCSADEGNRTRCSCGSTLTGADELTLLVNVPVGELAGCRIARAAGGGRAPPELSGSQQCTLGRATSDPKNCSRTMECTQVATSGGTQVTVVTSVKSDCYRLDTGAWACTC